MMTEDILFGKSPKATSWKDCTVIKSGCSDEPPDSQARPVSRGNLMCMTDSALAFYQPLMPSHIADVRLAASTMTGAKRRALEAERTLQYGAGNPLQADTTLGWSRRTSRGVGRKTHRDHVFRCAISLQWPQALGRPPSGSRGRPTPPDRSACPTRPDVSHDACLHAADRSSGARGLASPRL